MGKEDMFYHSQVCALSYLRRFDVVVDVPVGRGVCLEGSDISRS